MLLALLLVQIGGDCKGILGGNLRGKLWVLGLVEKSGDFLRIFWIFYFFFIFLRPGIVRFFENFSNFAFWFGIEAGWMVLNFF